MAFLQVPVVSNIGEFLSGGQYDIWKGLTVAGLVPSLIKLALILAAVVFFTQFLHGAINWMISAGNAEQLQKAQRELTSALIGLVIIFSTWAILNLVNYFFRLGGMDAGAPAGGAGQFDCCSIVGGKMKNKTECCKLVDSYGCASGRYQAKSSDCSKLTIDWNCWADKFAGGKNPDPSNYCVSQ